MKQTKSVNALLETHCVTSNKLRAECSKRHVTKNVTAEKCPETSERLSVYPQNQQMTSLVFSGLWLLQTFTAAGPVQSVWYSGVKCHDQFKAGGIYFIVRFISPELQHKGTILTLLCAI